MTYATPAGSARLRARRHDVRCRGGSTQATRELWLDRLLAVSAGALAASKWNGLFDFFVVWVLRRLVVAQRWLRRPAVFGNPFGMPLDVVDRRRCWSSAARSTRCATSRSSRWATTSSTSCPLQTRDVQVPRSPRRDASVRVASGGSGRSSNVRSRITITTSAPASARTIRRPAAWRRFSRCPTRSCGGSG